MRKPIDLPLNTDLMTVRDLKTAENATQAGLCVKNDPQEAAKVTVQEAAKVFLNEIRRIKFARLDAAMPIDRYFMNMPEDDLRSIANFNDRVAGGRGF